MRKLTLTALVAISAAALFGQDKDISGAWQGTLHAGKDLRTVLKISKADGGGLKATFYSIDQGGQGIPVTSISLQGHQL